MPTKPKPSVEPDAAPLRADKAPEPKARASRRDTLHVAYLEHTGPGFADAVVFGTRPEALEHAIDQNPPWKVTSLLKGTPLTAVLTPKEKP